MDPLHEFADTLRSKHGVEARSAILEQERVEIIRGKDLHRYIVANQDKVTLGVAKGKEPAEQTQEIGSLFLRRQLLVRCDRMYKKPPPGQQRLIKFPKKLVRVTGPDALTFSTDDFYAWTYDKPTSAWVYALSALAAIGVILVCLLPVAPDWVKIGVLYISAAILTVMLGTIAIRLALATATWLATGKAVWLLPNMMADDKPLSELFTPWIEVSTPGEKDSKWANHPLVRLLVAGALGGVGYILYSKAPDSADVRGNMGRYRDEIFEMLHLSKPAIGNETSAAGNDTVSGNTTITDSTAAGGEEATTVHTEL